MSRLIVFALLLAEVNFRCVPSSACAASEDRCAEGETEAETEAETEGETEAETAGEGADMLTDMPADSVSEG